MKRELHIHTDHFQFFLEDSRSTVDTSNLWDSHSTLARIAVREDLVSVGTLRFGGTVKVIVELLGRRPQIVLDHWDHVVECSISVPSGRLLMSGPETPLAQAEAIDLAAGSYRLLILFGNLNSVTDEMAPSGDDFYHLVLWPGKIRRPQVLKRAKD